MGHVRLGSWHLHKLADNTQCGDKLPNGGVPDGLSPSPATNSFSCPTQALLKQDNIHTTANEGRFVPPGHPLASGNVCGCHIVGKVCPWHLVSVAISAAQHPTMHQKASSEKYSNQNGKKVTVGNVDVASTCDLLLSACLLL